MIFLDYSKYKVLFLLANIWKYNPVHEVILDTVREMMLFDNVELNWIVLFWIFVWVKSNICVPVESILNLRIEKIGKPVA